MMEFGRTWKDGASLRRGAAETIVLQCDYNEEFIEALKQAIPWKDRRWDPKRTAWVIADQYDVVVRRLVAEYLGEYVVVRG